MRPRGPTREAMARAAEALTMVRGAATAHAMAQLAGLPVCKAQQMARDMERSGELHRCGTEALPHARRPALTYVPRHLRDVASRRLCDVTRSWVMAGRAT